MVLSFAMCASVAFAQTGHFSPRNVVNNHDALLEKAAPVKVDYKASIFTKANGIDTIQTFTFDNASDYTIGNVVATDMIDDTVVGASAHGLTNNPKAQWYRFSDSATFTSTYSSQFPGAVQYIGASFIWNRMSPTNNPGATDDGFMFLSLCDASFFSGFMNTYFTLPAVAINTAEAKSVMVALTQAYAKYYDECYIDYKIGGSWYAREINVLGVDVEVNSTASYKVRYTMPFELANESNVELRIRGAYTTRRGNAYGYAWAVDNVAVIVNTNEYAWAFSNPTNLDPYGMIPAGMNLPLAWGVNALNEGVQDINGARLTAYAAANGGNWNQVAAGNTVDLAAGDVLGTYPLFLNERGWVDTTDDFNLGMSYRAYWPGNSDNYGNQGALVGGYLGRGLPTNNFGQNLYTVTATGGSLTRAFDTVLYFVTDNEEIGTVPGYRWGRDNGVIASNAVFNTAIQDGFISSNDGDGHSQEPGYSVYVRYNSGNVIPEGWVFRGLELVARTDSSASAINGSVILPIALEDEYTADRQSFGRNSLPCGIDGLVFNVTMDDLNEGLSTGYMLPSDQYNAVTIKFLDEPVIKKNTSYEFGYRLQSGIFATASNATRYLINDSTWQSYSDEPALAAYANQNDPVGYYDMFVYDATAGSSIYASNLDRFPLIRPIVGPASEVITVPITPDCSHDSDTLGFSVSHATGDSICNTSINVNYLSSQRFYLNYRGDHAWLDSVVIIDGNDVYTLEEYDEETGEGSLMMLDEADTVKDAQGRVRLIRPSYYFLLGNFEQGHSYVIRAYMHWVPWNQVGIDPVAPEVAMTLAPNPATSMVKLNVNGVSGKVNCSIIDMSGRVVYNTNINAESEHMINVSGMPAGAYFVRITNDTFSKIEKLIIK